MRLFTIFDYCYIVNISMLPLNLKYLMESVVVAEVNVFDFDDTLVKTKSRIYLTTAEGVSITLTSGEYAVYESKPGDVFDFSDFEQIKNPSPISHMLLKLQYAIRNLGPANVFILTARGDAEPIRTFLKEMGISGINIIALGNSNPMAKADVIRSEILTRGVKLIKFFDDSLKNVAAVKALNRDPAIPDDVQIMSIKV